MNKIIDLASLTALAMMLGSDGSNAESTRRRRLSGTMTRQRADSRAQRV